MAVFYTNTASFNDVSITGSLTISGSSSFIGPIITPLGFTGSILGTASYSPINISTASYIDSTNIKGLLTSASLVATSSFTSASNFTTFSDYSGKSLNEALGSKIIAMGMDMNFNLYNATLSPPNNTLLLIAVYISNTKNIKGVAWYQQNAGTYTTSSGTYTGVGLYSYSNGTLTLVASSSNLAIFSSSYSSAITYMSRSFDTGYTASRGTYFIASQIHTASATLTPTIGASFTPVLANSIFSQDFSNSAKLYARYTNSGSLPSSLAMSLTSTPSTEIFAFSLY